MKVICECLSLSDPMLWRLSGGGIRKRKKKRKKKSEEKNLGRNYKTSRPTDGMPNHIFSFRPEAPPSPDMVVKFKAI